LKLIKSRIIYQNEKLFTDIIMKFEWDQKKAKENKKSIKSVLKMQL